MSEQRSTNAEHFNNLWGSPGSAARYANAEVASRPFAKIMVEKLDFASLDEQINVFDLATGTGIVVQELYDAVPHEKWDHIKVLGADVNREMLEYLKVRGEAQGWKGLETRVVDGNKEIDLPASSFTHITVSFAVFAMPNVLPTLFKLLKPGGCIAVSTWAKLGWYPLMKDSIAKMSEPLECPSPKAFEAALFRGKDWSSADYLADQLRGSGFVEVELLQEEALVTGGPPNLFMETMQFPLMVLKAFWGEKKWDERFKELNEVMLRETVERAGGEDGKVQLIMEGIVGWGRKAK